MHHQYRKRLKNSRQLGSSEISIKTPDWAYGEELKERVLQGMCTITMRLDVTKKMLDYQRRDGKAHFHQIDLPPNTYAGFMMMSTSPYQKLFIRKLQHMEQARDPLDFFVATISAWLENDFFKMICKV